MFLSMFHDVFGNQVGIMLRAIMFSFEFPF
jgi:hypothetical protein